MAVATCYMRLNKYDEALHMLQTVLDRSPNNYKALYHHAFCQRASGSQKHAIEGLTKVDIVFSVFFIEFILFFFSFLLFFLLLHSVHFPPDHISSNSCIIVILQILALSGPESSGSISASKLAMPIHRVYEMRGTMFHEMQGMPLFFTVDCL